MFMLSMMVFQKNLCNDHQKNDSDWIFRRINVGVPNGILGGVFQPFYIEITAFISSEVPDGNFG